MTPGDRVRHVEGWTGTVRGVGSPLRQYDRQALVHRDDTQRSEWVRVEDLSDADDA